MQGLYRQLITSTSAWLVCCALAGAAEAGTERLRILALFTGKAILEIDGARRVLSKGETSPEGVKLLEVDSEQAVVLFNGKRETLTLEVVTSSMKDSGAASVMLYSSGNAFYADGSINGKPVRFLIDTGATSVALSSALAKQIGINYRKGQPGMAKTASGFARIYGVRLEAVKLGEIVLYNVDAGVIEGSQPDIPLLGMSFLNNLEMRREGDRMELIKRF